MKALVFEAYGVDSFFCWSEFNLAQPFIQIADFTQFSLAAGTCYCRFHIQWISTC